MNAKEWFDDMRERFKDDPQYVAEGLALGVVIELGRAMRDQGLTQSELARRIGASPSFVSQTLHGRPNMTMLTLAKFALALGLECSLELRPPTPAEGPADAEAPAKTVPSSKPAPGLPGRPRREVAEALTAAK